MSAARWIFSLVETILCELQSLRCCANASRSAVKYRSYTSSPSVADTHMKSVYVQYVCLKALGSPFFHSSPPARWL